MVDLDTVIKCHNLEIITQQLNLENIFIFVLGSELKPLQWDILNPDRLINLEIKKKRRSSFDLNIHHSKVSSSDHLFFNPQYQNLKITIFDVKHISLFSFGHVA